MALFYVGFCSLHAEKLPPPKIWTSPNIRSKIFGVRRLQPP
jgi:hypothetical protein